MARRSEGLGSMSGKAPSITRSVFPRLTMAATTHEPPPPASRDIPPVGWRAGSAAARASGRALPLMLLALVMAAGTYLRVAELGAHPFGPDELNHYYVAESMRDGEGPRLPSGELYTRGLDISRLVRASVATFGVSEASVRLPSVVFGVLALALFAAIVWGLAGPWPSVLATILLAIYPEAVLQSRFTRFYTYQLVFGLVALYTGWMALRDGGRRTSPSREDRLRQWGYAILTVAALALAARVQVVSFSVTVGWGLCAATAGAMALAARGHRAWRDSVSLHITLAGATALLLVLTLFPDRVMAMWQASQYVPFWVRAVNGTHPLDYYYALVDRFPLIVSLSPVIFLVLLLRERILGTYLATWFTVPLVLHSFVFPWKGERFVFLAVPALFAATAIVAAWGASALHRLVMESLEPGSRLSPHRPLIASAVVGIATLGAVATTPAFNESRRLAAATEGMDWRAAAGILRDAPELAGVPVGSSATLEALHYLGHVDFSIDRDALELTTTDSTSGARRVITRPVGAPERKSGRPVLTTADAVRERFSVSGRVLIAFDRGHAANGYLDSSLVTALRRHAVELCRDQCGSLLLYDWRIETGGEARTSHAQAPGR